MRAATEKLPPAGATCLAQAELQVTDIPLHLHPSANLLGTILPPQMIRLPQIILFRRPIQQLGGDREFQAEVIYRTLVELLAELTARTPQSIDPRWGD